MQAFAVTGMTCDHCVRAVIEAVRRLDPEAKVQVDLASGRVVVRDARVDAAAITRAIMDEGYTAEALAR